MQKTIAKFACEDVTHHAYGGRTAKLWPVNPRHHGDTEENRSFWQDTPSGSIELSISNPAALGFFKPGGQYLVTFQEVEAE